MNESVQKVKQNRSFLNLEKTLISHRRYALEVYIKKVEDFLLEEKDRFQREYSQKKEKITKLTPAEKNFYELFSKNRLYQYEVEFPRILRNSFMVIAISLLESELVQVCKNLQDDYQIPISWKELQGSTLDKVKNYCKLAGLNLVKINEHWQEVNNFYLIRNCIVHNYGTINNMGSEKNLRVYAKNNGIISHESQSELNLTTPFCIKVVNVMEEFTDELWDMVGKKRPKRVQGV
jgi:hypothetical protein